MIDFHTHVLPNVDDGSSSLDESLGLLSMLARQGVSRVFATPHFDAMRDTPEAFFERRSRAASILLPHLTPDMPELLLGAELAYFPGVSRMSILGDMKLERTDLILLEMPICRWSEDMIAEMLDIAKREGIKLVLAHAERYIKYQPRALFDRLISGGILIQANASVFTKFTTRRRALARLAQGRIHLLGSDCHNLTSRPPRIGEAVAIIDKHLGPAAVTQLISMADSLFLENGTKD